jgi:25S rRNA (cytosine2278-C5)-methyltransferase
MHVQGKASCMPASALRPKAGWRVLDCCAAPGNKTTHLAALVGPQGAVLACERDAERMHTLKRTVARCRCTHVDLLHMVCASPAAACMCT